MARVTEGGFSPLPTLRLPFRALLIEDDARVLFYREAYD